MVQEVKQVSLIIPKDQNPEKPVFFLGVLYLASYLKSRNIPIRIYDEQLGEATKNIDEIIENSFLVGFTVMTSQLKNAKEWSQAFHRHKIPVVWGGFQPLLFPDQCLKEPYVDYLIYDEGEETLYRLAKNLQKGCPEKTIGIYYKKDGQIIKNRPRPYIDIEILSPDWSLIDISKYYCQVYYDGDKKDTFPLHVGRGCPYRCTFCINTLLNERKHRALSAESIVREIKKLLKVKLGIDNITFVDENFFMNLDRVKEFCKLYKEEKFTFTWIGTSRVNYVVKMSDELLKELRECGCVLFRFGIESGNQRVLDEIIKKDIKKDDVITAVEKLKKADISVECSFMTGLPGETEEEQKDTFNLFKKLVTMYDKLHIIGPQLYRPYPGAEMYQQAKKLGFNEPKSVDEWIDFLNNFGFLDINQLTWIPNKTILMRKCKYFAWSQINPKGLAKPIGLFFRGLFRLRMKLDFYYIGCDIWFYEKMKQCYIEKIGG